MFSDSRKSENCDWNKYIWDFTFNFIFKGSEWGGKWADMRGQKWANGQCFEKWQFTRFCGSRRVALSDSDGSRERAVFRGFDQIVQHLDFRLSAPAKLAKRGCRRRRSVVGSKETPQRTKDRKLRQKNRVLQRQHRRTISSWPRGAWLLFAFWHFVHRQCNQFDYLGHFSRD